MVPPRKFSGLWWARYGGVFLVFALNGFVGGLWLTRDSSDPVLDQWLIKVLLGLLVGGLGVLGLAAGNDEI